MSDPKPPGFEEVSVEFDAGYDERSADADADADADAAAGRVVPHKRVKQWLQSIIDGRPEPAPFSWRK